MDESDIDFKAYMSRYAELCPNVPVILEIISGITRPYPYLKPEFWKPYQQVRAHEFAKFVALAKRGKARDTVKLPEGKDKKLAEQEKRSTEQARYCGGVLGWG
jgi:hypothetical protein